MQRIIGLILSLLFLLHFINAQDTGTLRGVVRDSLSGEVLPFCNVIIEGTNTGASTDAAGLFFIQNLKANKLYRLNITYVGYFNKTLKVFISPNVITEVKVKLQPKSLEMQEVTKIGNKIMQANAPDIGLNRITVKQIESLPKGVEPDIFRALQYIPGVKFTSDISAKYNVWGGESSHNLIQLDRVTLYNPYHALGLFSAIDMDVVNSIEFFKGGYSAEYGGRLSSVMNVVTRTGNQNKFGGKASLSMLTGKILIEGPFINQYPMLIAVRKSHSTSILKKFFNNQNAPVNFWDVLGKISLKLPFLSSEEKASITGFYSSDKILYNDPTREDYNWTEAFLSVKLRSVSMDTPSFWEVYMSGSQYKGNIIPNQSSARFVSNKVTDYSITADYTYLFDNEDEIKAGIQIKDVSVHQNLEAFSGEIVNDVSKGSSIVVYCKYKFLSYENLGIDLGARFNLVRMAIGSSGQTYIEPRASVTYRFNPLLKFKTAVGKYTQELLAVNDENSVLNVFENWVIVPYYLNPPQNWHFLSGLYYDISENLSIAAEAYYKSIGHFTLINEKKFTISDPDFIEASGKAYGIDVSCQYTTSGAAFSLSYSFGDVKHTTNNITYNPKYNIRHSVNCLLDLNLGKGWRTGITWLYSSGRPFTQGIGYYDKADIGNFGDDNVLSNYYHYIILGEKNKGTLPDYHRMDINVNKKLVIGGLNCSLDFNIINVYNRANIFYYKRKTAERVNMLPFLPSVNLKVEI